VNKEICAVLIHNLVKSTYWIMWPSSTLKIISRDTVYKELALHRGFRLPNRLGAGELSVRNEEQLIIGAHREECDSRSPCPNDLRLALSNFLFSLTRPKIADPQTYLASYSSETCQVSATVVSTWTGLTQTGRIALIL
jgi:hypothetical protein